MTTTKTKLIVAKNQYIQKKLMRDLSDDWLVAVAGDAILGYHFTVAYFTFGWAFGWAEDHGRKAYEWHDEVVVPRAAEVIYL